MMQTTIPVVRLVRDGSIPYEAGSLVRDSAAVATICADLADEIQEHFVALVLNMRNEVIARHTVHIGTVSSCVIHPSDVFRSAIMVPGGQSIIVVHNHPSGSALPSVDDDTTTLRLVCAGAIIGVPLVDHVIIAAGGERFSYVDHGRLPPVPATVEESHRVAAAGTGGIHEH